MLMDIPTLRQLRTFIAASETGSVTAAARALHQTQPAASQQLRALERGLRLRLLERAEGRMVPTAAGAAIMEQARRAQAAVAEISAIASAYRSGTSGRVQLGTGATACIYLLPPVLARARARMPGLEIIVATGNSSDILRRVQEGMLDAGLVTTPRRLGRGLHRIPVCRDPLMALVPTDMAASDTLSPSQLAAMPLILFETAGDTRGIIDRWFRQAGLTPHPIMELGSVEAIKVLVGTGLGASVLPQLALGQPVPGAQVRPLRPPALRDLALVMRKEKLLERGLRVLIEALEPGVERD